MSYSNHADEQAALRDAARGLLANGSVNGVLAHHGNANGTKRGITLRDFASAKGFDEQFLIQCGVTEEKGPALVFHYRTLDGQRASRQRIRTRLVGDKRFTWNRAEGRPCPYGLARLAEMRKAGIDTLFLVAGESDALTCWAHNIAALGIPGAENSKILTEAHLAGIRQLYICRKNNEDGGTLEQGLVGRLSELQFRGDVHVVELVKAEAGDVNDLHKRHLESPRVFDSEFEALRLTARKIELALTGLEISSLETIVPKKVDWIWKGRLPVGKVSILAGDPGLGKSLTSLDIAARVSCAYGWPDQAPAYGPAETLIFSVEDDYADTVRPRCDALAADPKKIHVVHANKQRTADGQLVRRGFNFATDMPDLERAMVRMPNVRILIIDPFSAFLGRTDANSNSEMRGMILAPLGDFAQRHNICVILVTHLNKGTGSPMQRLSGSIGIAGAARTIWFFAKDPKDEKRTLMLPAKNNLAENSGGLAFHKISSGEFEVPVIAWSPETILDKPEDVLAADAEQRSGSGGSKLEAAKTIWREMLADGPRPYREIQQRAREMGISEMSLKRARWDLGVEYVRAGFGKGARSLVSLSHTMNQ